MTIDVTVFQDEVSKLWDLQLDENGDFVSDESFDSPLAYSLLGERRASPSQVAVSSQRRGWIGNEGKDFENGSLLWTFSQSRITRTILNDMQTVALNALSYLIEDQLLKDVRVSVEFSNGVVTLEIDLFRFNSKVDKRFFEIWNNTGIL